MIRRVQLNIEYANTTKKRILDSLFLESKRVVNEYAESLWGLGNFKSKFIDFKIDTWLSARMQQCLGKQSLEMVKSQRKKKKKTIPVFDKNVINLDQRFIDIRLEGVKYDIWIKLSSLGKKIKLCLPSKKHKHLTRYLLDPSWKMKKSVRLRSENGKYFIDLYFEKDAENIKSSWKSIGLDCGYKKLLIDSNGKTYDKGLEKIYEKISRKKQGSNRFKKALRERDNKINESVKSIDFNNLNTIVVEDLKDVKKNSRKKNKISKKFNNKLQRWSYTKVLDRLSLLCEENGINFIKVDPAYTSQTCNICGLIDRKNRSGEKFRCLGCGNIMDADHNAAINILRRGVYSPPTVNNFFYGLP